LAAIIRARFQRCGQRQIIGDERAAEIGTQYQRNSCAHRQKTLGNKSDDQQYCRNAGMNDPCEYRADEERSQSVRPQILHDRE